MQRADSVKNQAKRALPDVVDAAYQRILREAQRLRAQWVETAIGLTNAKPHEMPLSVATGRLLQTGREWCYDVLHVLRA